MDRSKQHKDAGTSSEDFWKGAQQVIAAGERAAQLLNSPEFNLAYRMQMEDTINLWLSSEPKEQNKRESLYYQAMAQAQMATRMQAFVEQAQRLLAEQHATDDPDTRRANYLDTQGFGIQ